MKLTSFRYLQLLLAVASVTCLAKPIEPNPVGWSVAIPGDYDLALEYPKQTGLQGCYLDFRGHSVPYSAIGAEAGVFTLRHKETGQYRPLLLNYKTYDINKGLKLLEIPDDGADYFIGVASSTRQLFGTRVTHQPSEHSPLCQADLVRYSSGSIPASKLSIQFDPTSPGFVQPQVLLSTSQGELLVKSPLEASYNVEAGSGNSESAFYPTESFPFSSKAGINLYASLIPRGTAFVQTPFRVPENTDHVVDVKIEAQKAALYYMSRQGPKEFTPSNSQNPFSPVFHQVVGWNRQGQLYISSVEQRVLPENGQQSALCIAATSASSAISDFSNASCSYHLNVTIDDSHYIQRVWQGRENAVFVTMGCKDKSADSDCRPYSRYFAEGDNKDHGFEFYASVISVSSSNPVVLDVWTTGGKGDESIVWYEAGANSPGKVFFITSRLPTCDDLKRLGENLSDYDECRQTKEQKPIKISPEKLKKLEEKIMIPYLIWALYKWVVII